MSRYREEFQGKGGRFIIRNAEGDDAAKIFAYMEYVDRETVFLAREPGEFTESYTLEEESRLLAQWAGGDEKLFLVAEAEDGEIAATCGCFYSSGRRRGRHIGEIAISVRKDFWQMGLGRRLMGIQMDWCREHRIEKLKLTVDTMNTRALGLYLSLGFVVEGTLRREGKLADGSYCDVYAMAKFFE